VNPYPNPTDSKLDLFFTCRLAGCLPRTNHSSPFAEEGRVFHKFLERVVELQVRGQPAPTFEQAREIALQEQPEELQVALAMLRTETLSLDPTRIAAEVAFAYDVASDTAREVGRGLGRNYGELAPTEYAGTIDRAALVSTDGAYAGDYKRWGFRLKKAAQNIQLKKAALNIARAWKRSWVEVELLRIDDDGEPWHDVARLEPYDLDAFACELQQLHARMAEDRKAFAEGEIPPAELGDHCKYCPGAPYCPARFAVARAVLTGENQELLRIAGKEVLVNADNAPRLWLLKERGERILEDLDRALRDFARIYPFALEDGRLVGPVPDPERKITDGERAAEVLGELLGDEPMKLGRKIVVTLEGMGTAVRSFLKAHPPPDGEKRGAIGRKEEEVFAVLYQRGLATVKQGVTVTAKKPKKEASK
jgi:hypothetical protein